MSKLEKILSAAKSHFEPDENAICAVMGAYEAKLLGKDTVKNGIFVATNKRIVFFGTKAFGGYDMEVFPYQNISSIEMSKGLMGHKISFFSSGNKVSMKWISKGDVHGLISEVKSRMGKTSDAANEQYVETDIPGQIKKLAELKEAGILTDEEFEKKKTELLAKM